MDVPTPQPLRRLRRLAGLSQRDLARAAGLDQSTVVGIERGHQRPYPSTCRKLAAALGVPVAAIRECRNGDEGDGEAG